MPTMDALELLEEDHERIKEVLGRLEQEGDPRERERLFSQARQELEVHETIEEEIFYPALKEHPRARDLVLEAYEEHDVVDMVMAQIEAVPFDDETWTAKLTVMKENVEHHIGEEEDEMFAQAREVFDADELVDLGTRMQGRREELLAGPGSQQGRGAA